MSGFVHDPRHRYSYELRPRPDLDHVLRTLARDLESSGLIEQGASTAPRFHPHLTLFRAAVAHVEAVEAAARAASGHDEVVFDSAGTFGDGRIVYVQMQARSVLDGVRAAAASTIEPGELETLVHDRPWTPHVTIAYAVPEPTRAAALALVESALPIRGCWGVVQCWDLDVRPTRLVHQQAVGAAG